MPASNAAKPPSATSRAEALHAFKWSILGEAASRLIAPAVFLVLARLLAPEAFGVVAAATVVIGFCQALADAGLGKALVQRRDELEAGATATFWIALGISLTLAALLVIAAGPIATFFGDSRIEPVVRLLALQVPLTGLAAVPVALLQRDLAFRELFWVRLATAGLPALASIPMALAGFGYWALVAGAVLGQALQCATLWWRSHWRPRGRLDLGTARDLMRFGRWTALSALLAWGYGWLDSLFVARYLGAHDMGLYRIGNTFVTMAFGLAFAPLLPVLYSLFSRTGHASDRVAAALMATARGIVLVALPAAALIAMLAPTIQAHLFGSDWLGLAPVLAMLAIGQGVAWLVGANGEAYRAVGRPDLEMWAMGLPLVVYVVGYAIAVRYGLLAFVATRAALVLAGLALHVYMADRLFGLAPRDWLAACAKPVAFCGVAAAGAWAATAASNSGVATDIGKSAIFLVVYILLVAAFDRRQLAWLMDARKSVTRPEGAPPHEAIDNPLHG